MEDVTMNPSKIVRAISIRQPYMELILRGKKRIEYRSTPTSIRERVYLYASSRPADDADAWRKAKADPGDLPSGEIVGTVEIAGCRISRFEGCYEYLLVRPRRLRSHLHPINQPQPRFWRPKFGTRRSG